MVAASTGVIGRDILADSLVFTFDRDNGIIVLATQKAAPFPKDMTTFRYSLLDSRIQNAEVLPISRRLVDVTIGGQKFAMHVDFGQKPSQLRPRSWAKAGLAESDVKIALVDEVGMSRDVKKQGVAESVTVGPVTATMSRSCPTSTSAGTRTRLKARSGLTCSIPTR